MGVLDWLTDLGNSSGGSFLGGGPMEAPPTPMATPMPPVQQTGDDMAPLGPSSDPSTSDLGVGGAAGPGATPPIPLPQPRPQIATPAAATPAQGNVPDDNGDTGTPPLPLNPTPGSPPLPPNPASAIDNSNPPAAHGILGRALGIDPNTEAQLRGSLGAGLTAAGNSAGKSPFQAFASGAGASITGGKQAADKTADQQNRFLQTEMAASKMPLDNAYKTALTQQALAEAKYKMTGGRDSVINSDQQLYLRGLNAVHQQTMTSAMRLQQIQNQYGVDSPQAKAAQAQHEALVEQTKQQVFKTLGITEAQAEKVGKQPGMSFDNPVPKEGLTKEKFDALPPGSYFVNPKDGRVLIKKGPAGANPSGAPQSPPIPTPQSQMTPNVPPTPPAPPG